MAWHGQATCGSLRQVWLGKGTQGMVRLCLLLSGCASHGKVHTWRCGEWLGLACYCAAGHGKGAIGQRVVRSA